MTQLIRGPEFDFQMSKIQLILGLIWLPIHVFLLPILYAALAMFFPGAIDDVTGNVAFQSISFIFLLIVMQGYLKKDFYTLCSRLLFCVITIAAGWMINLMLAFPISLLIDLILPGMSDVTPNQETVESVGNVSRGALIAMSVCFAPIVEECLFRGCLFGAIRRKNRLLAYIVSCVFFSAMHVWQYVLIYQDPMQLVYMLRYIPISFALCWCYDRSGSIWTSIFLHMATNATAIAII